MTVHTDHDSIDNDRRFAEDDDRGDDDDADRAGISANTVTAHKNHDSIGCEVDEDDGNGIDGDEHNDAADDNDGTRGRGDDDDKGDVGDDDGGGDNDGDCDEDDDGDDDDDDDGSGDDVVPAHLDFTTMSTPRWLVWIDVNGTDNDDGDKADESVRVSEDRAAGISIRTVAVHTNTNNEADSGDTDDDDDAKDDDDDGADTDDSASVVTAHKYHDSIGCKDGRLALDDGSGTGGGSD